MLMLPLLPILCVCENLEWTKCIVPVYVCWGGGVGDSEDSDIICIYLYKSQRHNLYLSLQKPKIRYFHKIVGSFKSFATSVSQCY